MRTIWGKVIVDWEWQKDQDITVILIIWGIKENIKR